MKKFSLIIGLMLGIGYNIIKAQTANQTELKIGDTVPDITFNNIVNWHKTTAKLSDFKGKLVILDFWTTWCDKSMAPLPKLNDLQKQFKDDLVILPISNEKPEVIKFALQNNINLNDVQLPFVTATSLQEFFPFMLLPHEVWIDQQGKVLAITSDTAITDKNIKAVLANNAVQFSVKKDVLKEDYTKPLLLGALKGYTFNLEQLKAGSSIFEGRLEGVGSPEERREGVGSSAYWHPTVSPAGGSMIKIYNSSINRLYQVALLDYWSNIPKDYFNNDFYLNYDYSRILWEVNQCQLNPECKTDSNKNTTLFTYELITPRMNRFDFKKYMLDDLNRYFGLKYGIVAGREKRLVECWALTYKGNDALFKTKGGLPSMDFNKYKMGLKVTNSTIDEFLYVWLHFSLEHKVEIPIINDTGYKSPIDLDLNVNQKDFNAVKEALSKLGLEFKLVKKEIDMIVFKSAK